MLLELIASITIVPALVIATFALLFSLAQFMSPERVRRLTQNRWPFRANLWHIMVGVAVAACLFFAAAEGVAMVLLVISAAVLVIAWFLRAWCDEIVFLMSRRDPDFPGRHDKLIWLIVLAVFAPIGLWVFRSFRSVYWPATASSPELETGTQSESARTSTSAAQPA
jgi:hypothetical protein